MRRKRTFYDWMTDSWIITQEALANSPHKFIILDWEDPYRLLVRVRPKRLSFLEMLGLRTPLSIVVLKVI